MYRGCRRLGGIETPEPPLDGSSACCNSYSLSRPSLLTFFANDPQTQLAIWIFPHIWIGWIDACMQFVFHFFFNFFPISFGTKYLFFFLMARGRRGALHTYILTCSILLYSIYSTLLRPFLPVNLITSSNFSMCRPAHTDRPPPSPLPPSHPLPLSLTPAGFHLLKVYTARNPDRKSFPLTPPPALKLHLYIMFFSFLFRPSSTSPFNPLHISVSPSLVSYLTSFPLSHSYVFVLFPSLFSFFLSFLA